MGAFLFYTMAVVIVCFIMATVADLLEYFTRGE